MTPPRPARALRDTLGVVLACCLVASVLVAVTVGRSGRAEAGTTGGPYGVYLSAGSSMAQVPSNGLSASPSTFDALGNAFQYRAVAINSDATLGVLTAEGDGTSLSRADVFSVPGDAVVGSVTDIDPVGMAADPVNPSTVFAVDYSGNVYALHLGPGTVGPPPPLAAVDPAGGSQCSSIAVNPSGTVVVVGCYRYSSGAGYLTALSTSGQITATWPVPYVDRPLDLAVSPDGTAVYGIASGGRLPIVFRLPISFGPSSAVTWSQSLVKPVPVPTALTVSRDGATVYVGGNNGVSSSSGVAAFAASSGARGVATPVAGLATDGNGNGGLSGLALTPDGVTLLAFGQTTLPSGGQQDYLFPLSPSTLAVGGSSASFGNARPVGPHDIAVTPDQAPVANLAPASGRAGSPVTLDASSSTVTYGAITRYVWSFGDGTPAVTTTVPGVSHTWAAPGNYTAAVVETDSAGTSVSPAPFAPGAVNGPGTTPYLNSSPSAAVSVPVLIGQSTGPPPPPPTTAPHGGTPTTAKHPPAYHPVIMLDRAVGSPGEIVTVTGHGFPPGKTVKVEWSTKTASFQESADSHGNLPAHAIFLLTPDVLGPRLAVATVTGTSTSAQAKFLVVPGTARPGGGSGDVLFRSEGP